MNGFFFDDKKKPEIYNEDCFKTMERLTDKVDIILTSPFYNTNKKAGKSRTIGNTHVKSGQYNYVRYDVHVDNMTNDEYCDYTVKLFNSFGKVLRKNGCVLYNISYGAENTEGMFLAVADILRKTDFTLADTIIWKKKSAFPNSCSPNRLTRITEYIFVFCRKDELMTFRCNKKVVSRRPTGQAMYENVFNFIEAANNDGPCPYNKATFSSELVEKLLDIYANEDSVVYDPFMGSGTTAVGCIRKMCKCYGSELSENQCRFAEDRIEKELRKYDCQQVSLF